MTQRSSCSVISIHSSGISPCLDSITVRRVRPSPASEANSLIFCTAGGASTKALSSVPRNPFLGTYTRENSEVVSVRLLKAACINVGPDAPCDHERLFRRPAQEDRRGQRTRDAHHRGRSRLWRGPLFGQALRKDGPRRGIAAPQEQSGQTPEGGREREE